MIEKTGKIWMDGQLVDWHKAQIHVLTHTLHYGLGVFEGIRCYRCHDGRSAIFRLPEHINRLFDSAHISQITIPFSREEMTKAVIETMQVNNLSEGYIRPIVYIGDGEMGLYVKQYPVRVAIACWAWGAYLGDEGLKRGIRAKISSFTRVHVNTFMTKAKICGSYVNSIMAKKEVTAMGYDEAILLDTEGYVCEASGENIFIIKDGTIKTPPPTAILKGITRDAVFTIARDRKISVDEQRFTRDELYTADEAFFTGTAAEITPIREVDNRTIGKGERGPLTAAIQSAFFDTVQGKDERYRSWLTYL
jgi:branched-chain amino acid aminotransferase